MRCRSGVLAVLALALLCLCSPAYAGALRAYAGSQICGTCHPKEYESWKATRMANAFELLKPGAAASEKRQHGLDPAKDYTRDASCLPCHTTGYGKPGGFVDMASTPDRAGVGCEVCHGPGEDYVRRLMGGETRGFAASEAVAAGLVVEISKGRCLSCHNEKSVTVAKLGGRQFAKEFRFEERVERGVHKRFSLRYQH